MTAPLGRDARSPAAAAGGGRRRAWTLIGMGAAALAFAALVAFGVVGVGRGDARPTFDMYVLWVAGSAWWHGANAYDPAQLVQFVPAGYEVGPFAYAPQSAPLCMLLAAMEPDAARWCSVALNAASLWAIDRACQEILREIRGRPDRSWFLTAILVGNPFTTHVVFMGQTSLLALAAALHAWRFAGRNRPMIAGVLTAVASVKPQMCLLLIAWFLLERRIALLAWAAAAAGAFMIPAVSAAGPVAMLAGWIEAVRSYGSHYTNVAGFEHSFGLRSFVEALGVPLPFAPVFALATLAVTWRLRERLDRGTVVALLIAASLLFIFAHDYDLVGMLPFVAVFMGVADRRRGLAILGACLLCALSVPQRFVRPAGSAALDQFRVPVVLLAIGAWAWVAARDLRRAPPPVEEPPSA